MRVLFLTCQPPHHMAPPVLGDEQINGGPWFADEQIAGRWLTRTTGFGDYDVAPLAASLPADQQPDVVVCHVDCGFCLRPRNLEVFTVPKVLLAADSHWGDHAVSGMVRYATSEPFDRTILLYDRHHAALYRAAGIKHLHWLPGFTLPHPDAVVARPPAPRRTPQLALVGKTGYHFRRQRLFAALLKARLPLDWRELPQRAVPGFYGSSLIGLNVAMNGDLNLRTFEILAGGALLLTDRLAPAAGLDELLTEGVHKVTYDDADHLVALAGHYLDHPDEAAAIGAAGRQWYLDHWSAAHRRDAFQALVESGRERPEFVLPAPPPTRVAVRPPELARALAAYDHINELHRQRERVRVNLTSTAPRELASWLTTLPRVETTATPETADVSVGTSAPPTGLMLVPGTTEIWSRPAPRETPAARQAQQARGHLENGDLTQALEVAQATLKQAPHSWECLLVLAELAREAGNESLAQKVLGQARTLAPDAPEPVLLDWRFRRQDWPQQGKRLLATAWRCLERLDLSAAEKIAQAALATSAELASAHYLLGLVHARLGAQPGAEASRPSRLEARVQHLQRAHELEPDNPVYAHALALAWRAMGNLEATIATYRRALALEPGLTAAALGLGEACLELGQWEEARLAFDQGLHHAPRHRLLHSARLVADEEIAGEARTCEQFPFVRAMFDWADQEIDLPVARQRRQWRTHLRDHPGLAGTLDLARQAYLPDGEILRLWAAASRLAIATTSGLADHPGLPSRRIMMTFQPWFELDLVKLIEQARDRDLLTVLVEASAPVSPLPEMAPENVRNLTHQGLRLWDLAAYRLALELRCPPTSIDPGEASHRTVIRRVYGETITLIDRVKAGLDFYQPETVIIAQGHDLVDAILHHLAVREGRRVVALENILHRDRLLWDDVAGLAVNRNLAHNHYWRYAAQVPDHVAHRTAEVFLTLSPGLKSTEHASPVEAILPPVAPAIRTITYLAQVGNDASILFGLRGFADQAEVLAVLATEAARHGHRLIVKLHPKESPRFEHRTHYYRRLTADWLDRHPKFQTARQELGDRLFIDETNQCNTHELIRLADVCVTINSQAGLEAALLGKEVVLCGRAFYGGLGFTHEADDAASLARCVEQVVAHGQRRNTDATARRFFHIFTELYCLPKSVESLLRLMNGPLPWRGVPPAPDADAVQGDLAYDVGMNNGDDTAYYLSLGYRVVAIEADPDLCARARRRFESALVDGRLTVLNLGITAAPGVSEFWICEHNRVWNSFDRAIASRDGQAHHAIPVPGQTFAWVLAHFGVPHALKIDIEGHDHLCLQALEQAPAQPVYLSVEIGRLEQFVQQLTALGFDGFKCISQYNHEALALPDDPCPLERESQAPGSAFPEGSSGPMGEETPGRWLNAAEVLATYQHYREACRRGESSPYWFGRDYSFWVDLHARRSVAASPPPVRRGHGSSVPATTDPASLLYPARLDLVVKYRYFRALAGRGDHAAAEKLYRRHIMQRTGGCEPPDATDSSAPGKRTLDDYLAAARELHASMQRRGFDPAGAIPLTTAGELGNGAHRLACALALGHTVTTRPCATAGPAWDLNWFRSHGFDEDTCRDLLHGWVSLQPARSALFVLWAPVASAWPDMEEAIARNFAVVGATTLDLGDHPAAFHELVHDIYSHGQDVTRLEHIARKLTLLAAHPARLRIVVAWNQSRAEGTGDLATRTKRHLRQQVAALAPVDDYITCHATADTAEAAYLNAVLLDRHNLPWLRRRPAAAPRREFLRWMETFKAALKRENIPLTDCCIVGSSSLEVLGLRLSTDLDFTLKHEHRHPRFGPGITALADHVDIVTEGYHRVHAPRVAITDDELIDDPRHHFLYRGIKFANPTIILDRKDYSRRPKDIADVNLILAHLKAESALLGGRNHKAPDSESCISSTDAPR